MIVVENTLISELIAEKKFVCNLSRCKGECCVAGDAGAPLEESEALLLEEYYPHYKEYLTEHGIKTISKHGFFELDADNDYLTPIVREEKHCAFVYFDGEIAKCAIEKTFNEGRINFRKPISCHLYPIRITSFKEVDALNYHHWDVCQPACELGNILDIPVYKFLKEPLQRKYGKEWFEELEREINKY